MVTPAGFRTSSEEGRMFVPDRHTRRAFPEPQPLGQSSGHGPVNLFRRHSFAAPETCCFGGAVGDDRGSKTEPAMHHRFLAGVSVAAAIALLSSTAVAPAGAEETYALSMHGDEAFPDGPRDHFPWVDREARKGGDLSLAIVGTFDSMNPYIVQGLPAAGLKALVFQSLLYRSPDEPFTLYPQVARAIEIADDRTRIVFHLDPRARFHDGTEVTAEDVLFTFDALLNDGRPHTQTYFSGVTGVQELGPLSVSFDLRGDNWELPLLLGLMPVLSKEYFETVTFTGTSLEIPVGTGPYRVESIDPGHRVIYRRDPDYWGRDLPQSVGRYNFDTMTYTWYRDSNVAHQAFLAGDSNIRFEGDSRRWVTGYDVPARDDGRIIMASVASGRPSGLYAVVWNHRRSPFDDVRVRDAWGLPLISTGSTRTCSTASTRARRASLTTPRSGRQVPQQEGNAPFSSPGGMSWNPSFSKRPGHRSKALCASA